VRLSVQLEWDETRGLRLKGEGEAWVPPSDAQAWLTDALYRRYFCRWREGQAPSRTGDPAFVERLLAAADGATTWSDGWSVTQRGEGWVYVSNGSVQVFVEGSDDVRPAEPELEARVQVRLPCAREGASPGFFFLVGRAGRLNDGAAHLRLYLNVTARGALGCVEALAKDPRAARLRFEAKFVNDPSGYGRVDTGIVYVDPRSFAATLALVRRLVRAHPGWWRAGTPAFTSPLGKGLAAAEAPRSAESYGESRCRLMADGVLRALRAGERGPAPLRARVAEAFAEAGLSLERPYAKHLRWRAGVVSAAMPRAARRKKALPPLTARLRLGATGLEVSPFCLGMVDSPDAVVAAFDAGINFFFLTADMHWPLYEATRAGLARLLARGRGIRDRIVVCAAAYVTQPDFCELPFREVLDAVPGLKRLDILAAGGAYAQDFWPRLEVYEAHRRSQFCGAKAIAASFHDRPTALTAIAGARVDLAFVRYNAGHAGAREDLFPLLPAKRRARLFNFKSTSAYLSPERCAALGVPSRYWVPTVTDHYRFALTQPQVDGVLLALDSGAQVRALSDALAEGPLDPEQQRYMMDLSALDQESA
jgi:hypothetical protein